MDQNTYAMASKRIKKRVSRRYGKMTSKNMRENWIQTAHERSAWKGINGRLCPEWIFTG